jgi:hypothetical protein
MASQEVGLEYKGWEPLRVVTFNDFVSDSILIVVEISRLKNFPEVWVLEVFAKSVDPTEGQLLLAELIVHRPTGRVIYRDIPAFEDKKEKKRVWEFVVGLWPRILESVEKRGGER